MRTVSLFVAALVVAGLGVASLVGCGGEDAPPPVPSKPAKPASRFAGMKVSHILIGMKAPRMPKITRSKEQALVLATSILADVKGGRDFLDAARAFSDDNKDGIPNTNCGEPGTYEGKGDGWVDGFAKPFQDALLATPVGTIHPTPVFSEQFGYFLIRRVR